MQLKVISFREVWSRKALSALRAIMSGVFKMQEDVTLIQSPHITPVRGTTGGKVGHVCFLPV